VVLGYVVRGPVGGMGWSNLLYLAGLSRLGHDVWFLEDSDDYPSCYDPSRHTTGTDPTYGLRFAHDVFERIGLGGRWAYHDAHTTRWHGPAADSMTAVCADADLLVDIAALNPLRPWVANIPHRALIDTDPVFTQLRILEEDTVRSRAEAHTSFFTFAENVRDGRAHLPDDGLPWQPTRQPLVSELWPLVPPTGARRFTTVMLWESYPAREHRGRRYGMKSDSFGPYLGLPRTWPATFELALGGPSAPRELLREHGWSVVDALEAVPDPWTYRRYIQQSDAEFAVAKHGYVAADTGWFSERSVCYLASGRPVVAQDTGFSAWLPTGEGLLPFTGPEEAAAAVADVEARYESHYRAARSLAEEYFDHRSVLTSLIERATSSSGQRTAEEKWLGALEA
jgi:hypothetical protein